MGGGDVWTFLMGEPDGIGRGLRGVDARPQRSIGGHPVVESLPDDSVDDHRMCPVEQPALVELLGLEGGADGVLTCHKVVEGRLVLDAEDARDLQGREGDSEGVGRLHVTLRKAEKKR